MSESMWADSQFTYDRLAKAVENQTMLHDGIDMLSETLYELHGVVADMLYALSAELRPD